MQTQRLRAVIEGRRNFGQQVIEVAKSFAGGDSDLQALNPAWDHRFLDVIDSGHLADLDGNGWKDIVCAGKSGTHILWNLGK